MTTSYFSDLTSSTPTRVWVNNPTIDEIGLALANGAVGCTTNPAFGGGLLKRAPDEIRPIIAESVRATDDDAGAADLVQRRLVARIAERFRPLYEASEGKYGYVSIQGAPEVDDDPIEIVNEGRRGHAIGPNAVPKLPATEAGLKALDILVTDGYPVIVTEVFSLAQLVAVSEHYVRATAHTGVRTPCYVGPITGILGDYLKSVAARDGLPIAAQEMELAGVALARECYRVVQERSYPVTLLCGGARVPFDLTGLVGAGLQATINWSTFAEVLADPNPLERGFERPIDAAAIERLQATFPDVRAAFSLDGLTIDAFDRFGPVQYFRNNFIAGWTAVRQAIAEERVASRQGSRL